MPKSFLVKKASRNKRKAQEEPADQDNEERTEVSGQKAEDFSLGSSGTDDVAIQCNLELSIRDFHLQRSHSKADHSQPPVHFPALDTRGLHTLAELCLRRADYEFCTKNVNVENIRTEQEIPVYLKDANFKESQKLREAKEKRDENTFRRKLVKLEAGDDSNKDGPRKYEDLIQRNEPLTRNSTNIDESNTSRLEKLEEELEKMLQGKEEIIGREIREFMENNKALEEELREETGVSQIEISKYLLEGVHLNEDKRKRLFRWYLEKKLSRMDSDDESFTCYKCGKIFAYESYLERHVKYVCPDKTGRTWKCSYCSKAFQYPCYLRRHMRSHTGESPYKCTQCSRAFVRSTDLQRHLRNHTGEKPYKCQECSRAFARSTDLKRHMRTHTGEKPYKCWQCSKAFSQSGSLQTHLHTHYKESLQIKGVLGEKTKRT